MVRAMPNESTRTVLVALVSGLGVALAKFGAAAFTGSPALAAEASHSLADTANDLFLLIAQRSSARPRDDRHPLGFGRESYFWSLIAALGVFVAGAAFSLRQGIAELVHPGTTSSFAVAYVVLGIASVFDLVSLHQSGHQMSAAARRANRTLRDQSAATSDPTLRAVFLEDAISISGDLLALAGLALNQITGSSIPQALAAVVIGLMLIRASLRLIRRSHDFLLGQPLAPSDKERVRALLLAYPGVTAISELLVTFIGPDQVWVLARLAVDSDLRGDHVMSLARGIESALKHESKNIYRVDVVPIGEPQPQP
jgi:cation diffusion facilitator family transporter